MAAGTCVHIALVCGYLTAIWPGFARADEVEDLKKLQHTMLAQQIDNDIFRTREAQCQTLSSDAKVRLYLQRLQDKLQQWPGAFKDIRLHRVPGYEEFGPARALTGP